MDLTRRLTRIVSMYDQILATDIAGGLHLLDHELQLVRSSATVPGVQPVYGVAWSEDRIVARDRIGTLTCWDATSLDLLAVLDPNRTCDETALLPGEEPSPALNRGICILDGVVYTNNGYGQVVSVELETFSVIDVAPSLAGDAVPLEWMCTEHPTLHAISDKSGRLFLGDLRTLEFPRTVRLDQGNLHRVRYDPEFDRFWVTQDFGDGDATFVENGILTVTPDGRIEQSILFAQDDVECLEFAPDGRTVYAGGFDGELVEFDNSDRKVRITRRTGPFSHQIIDCAVSEAGAVSVLTQDGELRTLADTPDECRRAPFRRACVWDIQHSDEDRDRLYIATDSGVAIARVADERLGPVVTVLREYEHGHGFSRRVVPVEDGCAGITRDGNVFCMGTDGALRWTRASDKPGLLNTLSASGDRSRLLVAASWGGAEIDARSGEWLTEYSLNGGALWASAYLPSGEAVLATHNGVVGVFDGRGQEMVRLETGDYPKRMWWQDETLYVTGGNGVKAIDLAEREVRGQWVELCDNTCENAVVVNNLVCAVSYGCQLLVYSRTTGELVGLAEGLPDFTKAVTVLRTGETPVIGVGGRGGFLITFRLKGSQPERLREVYLRGTIAHPAGAAWW